MNNTEKYLGLWPCFFDVVTGCPFSQPRHPRRRTRQTGLRQRFGNPLCMWEMSDFFWSEKISLDDSFDQSKKNNMKFGEVVLQTQLGCRWMATANRSTAFCCLHRLDV